MTSRWHEFLVLLGVVLLAVVCYVVVGTWGEHRVL